MTSRAMLKIFISGIILLNFGNLVWAQNTAPRPTPTEKPTPRPTTVPEPGLTAQIPEPGAQIGEIPRERRAEAYSKLLEGQRYLWIMERTNPKSASFPVNLRLARQALQKSVELNPALAEGYTALAELTLRQTPVQIEDAVRLATIAKSINPDNFGARRLLSRVYTIKSGLYENNLDKTASENAIAELKAVARLNPRDAEAWALLSDFYQRTKQNKEEIEALQKWIGAAAPTEARFYYSITGKREISATEASARLGDAYMRAGRTGEAIAVISEAIADDPENAAYTELLRQAVATGNEEDATRAIQALEQAVYASPNNLALIELLVQTRVRAGQIDSAVKTLRETSEKAKGEDKNTAARLLVLVGNIYGEALRENDALTAYNDSLKLQGIDKTPVATDGERDFVGLVFPKIINIYRNAGRFDEAKAAIERLRVLLGKNDTTADLQLIQLLRGQGDKNGALQAVRVLRQKNPDEPQLLQTEAAILKDLGRVDEGVALLRAKISNKDEKTVAAETAANNFQAYLSISALYSDAGRGADAVSAAKKALVIADQLQIEQWQKIAKMTLATAQHRAGDYSASETTLREIIKVTPNDPIALNNLGYFLLERNERFTEALELIQKAVKIEPTNSSYLDSLGWAYFKLNKFAEAENNLLAAARRNPNSATIQDHLGDVYQKQGKLSQARSAWQKALSLTNNPDETAKLKVKLGEAAKKNKTL